MLDRYYAHMGLMKPVSLAAAYARAEEYVAERLATPSWGARYERWVVSVRAREEGFAVALSPLMRCPNGYMASYACVAVLADEADAREFAGALRAYGDLLGEARRDAAAEAQVDARTRALAAAERDLVAEAIQLANR